MSFNKWGQMRKRKRCPILHKPSKVQKTVLQEDAASRRFRQQEEHLESSELFESSYRARRDYEEDYLLPAALEE